MEPDRREDSPLSTSSSSPSSTSPPTHADPAILYDEVVGSELNSSSIGLHEAPSSEDPRREEISVPDPPSTEPVFGLPSYPSLSTLSKDDLVENVHIEPEFDIISDRSAMATSEHPQIPPTSTGSSQEKEINILEPDQPENTSKDTIDAPPEESSSPTLPLDASPSLSSPASPSPSLSSPPSLDSSVVSPRKILLDSGLHRNLSAFINPDHRELARTRVDDFSRAYSTAVKRQAAALEILSTEQSYVSALQVFEEVFCTRVRGLVPDGALLALFQHIASIIALSIDLRNALQTDMAQRDESGPSTATVGARFLEYAPFFKFYTQYCDCYDAAQQQHAQFLAHNSEYKQRCDDLMAEPRAKGLSVGMFLIMPVQRIPRYLLLLTALRDYTPETLPGRSQLLRAIESVKQVTQHVDRSVKNAENRAKVLQIAQRFIFTATETIVEPHRVFVRDGAMSKHSLTDHSIQLRQVYLFSDIILTASTLFGEKQKVDKMIPLHSAWLLDRPDSSVIRHAFWLVAPEKTHLFSVLSHTQKRDWMASINDVTVRLITHNPRLASEREQLAPRLQLDQFNLMSSSTDPRPAPHPQVPFKSCANLFQETPTLRDAAPRNAFLEAMKPKKLVANALELMRAMALMSVPEGVKLADKADALRPSARDEKDDDFVMVSSALLGQVQVAKEVSQPFQQLRGDELAREDSVEGAYEPNSLYLCFEASYNYIFASAVGYIGLRNLGDSDIVLAGQPRRRHASSDRPLLTLHSKQEVYLDFKGHWALEILQGDPGKMLVLDYQSFGGSGEHNSLRMAD